MPPPVRRAGCLWPGLAASVSSLLMFVVLMPSPEQTRQQARYSQTYDCVMTLASACRDHPDWTIESAISAGAVDEFCSTDPWETPIQMMRQQDDSVVFVSAGEDRLFGTGDDFRSDMTQPPVSPSARVRSRQLTVAMMSALVAWNGVFWSIRRLTVGSPSIAVSPSAKD
ncbi:MAG: hypothetical protein ACK5Q5_03675 [Planctomycetaceae bacterium]